MARRPRRYDKRSDKDGEARAAERAHNFLERTIPAPHVARAGCAPQARAIARVWGERGALRREAFRNATRRKMTIVCLEGSARFGAAAWTDGCSFGFIANILHRLFLQIFLGEAFRVIDVSRSIGFEV